MDQSEGVQFRYTTLAPLSLGEFAAKERAIENGGAHASDAERDASWAEIATSPDFLSLGIVEDKAPVPAIVNSLEDRRSANQAEASTSGRVELPWAEAGHHIRSPMLRLHNEVVEFCRFLTPTPDEKEAREDAIARVTEVIKEIWASADVMVFGSFATGLYLPTSDLDLVIVNSGCEDIPSGLKAIANSLLRKKMAKNVQIIGKAKVPIIKFDDVDTGLPFDISFDVANGPEAAGIVMDMLRSLPAMRPLVLILKIFLQQRLLNEVYQGGIGSYALLVMVAAFLLTHHSRKPLPDSNLHHRSSRHKHKTKCSMESSLGVLLVEFFRLYGRTLNVEHVGVSCREGGFFFAKRSRPGFYQEGKYDRLAVEDPNDPSNDLAKGSFNIKRVCQAFDHAYMQLTRPVAPEDSFLRRIIRLDAIMMGRQPGKWPEDLVDRSHDASCDNAAPSHRGNKLHAPEEEEGDGTDRERHRKRRRESLADTEVTKTRRKRSPNTSHKEPIRDKRKQKSVKEERHRDGHDAKRKSKKRRERDLKFGDFDSEDEDDREGKSRKRSRHNSSSKRNT